MKTIHVLPTDKPSRLYLSTNEYIFEEVNSVSTDECQNKHIYITSDEEIKTGDYVLDLKDNSIWAIQVQPSTDLSRYKKIILTTDQDLIKDGVQAIDDEFLEWFVKNPSCEKVEVVKGFADGTAWGYNFLDYRIIIPKEETKQTAVEWYGIQIGILISKFFNNEISKSELHFKRLEIEEQAKEIDEQEANVLLISKAPKMLELLEKFVKSIEDEEIIIEENFDNDGFESCGFLLYKEFKQLIKEATEI